MCQIKASGIHLILFHNTLIFRSELHAHKLSGKANETPGRTCNAYLIDSGHHDT